MTNDLTSLFHPVQGFPHLTQLLFNLCDPLTQLSLAHTCQFYKQKWDQQWLLEPLKLEDLEFNARFPERLTIREPCAKVDPFETGPGKFCMMHLPREGVERDLKRLTNRKKALRIYTFE